MYLQLTFFRHIFRLVATLGLFVSFAAPIKAHGPHVHGKGELQIGLQGSNLSMTLQLPQDSVVGFERPPRNPKEVEAAEKALTTLKKPAELISISAAAECALKDTKITAPALEAQQGSKQTSEHADVIVQYRWECAKPDQIQSVTVNAFDVFKRLKVVQAQLAGFKRQKGARLVSSAREIKI